MRSLPEHPISLTTLKALIIRTKPFREHSAWLEALHEQGILHLLYLSSGQALNRDLQTPFRYCGFVIRWNRQGYGYIREGWLLWKPPHETYTLWTAYHQITQLIRSLLQYTTFPDKWFAQHLIPTMNRLSTATNTIPIAQILIGILLRAMHTGGVYPENLQEHLALPNITPHHTRFYHYLQQHPPETLLNTPLKHIPPETIEETLQALVRFLEEEARWDLSGWGGLVVGRGGRKWLNGREL